MKTKLPHIGIFWVYKSTVLAKAMPLNSTEPDSLSLYDSDFSHLVEWEVTVHQGPIDRQL